MCFACVYPYSVDVVEAAPLGAAEDHWSCWDMQTRGHHFCCTCFCSSGEYNSWETFFLQCSSLERASRSLAKTGLFFCLFWSLFLSTFSVRLFEVLEGSLGVLGSFLSHLGSILESFWWLFEGKGDLWKRMFYYSKTRLFQVWEGLELWLFRCVFCIRFLAVTFTVFFRCLSPFLCPCAPKRSPWEHPQVTISSRSRALIPRGCPGML